MANLDSFLGGLKAGNDIAEMGRSQRNRAMIGNLAPAIVGGDPQAFVRAAAVDPAAAKDLQASGEGLMKRTRGAAQYLESALKSGNEAQIAAARRSVKPFMDTLQPGASYPMDMDPQQELAGIQSFLAQTAHLDPTLANGTPTDVRSFQLMTQGLSPEDQERARRINLGLDGRTSSAAIGYQKITGPDGREYLVATDPRQIGSQIVGDGTGYGSFSSQGGAGVAQSGDGFTDVGEGVGRVRFNVTDFTPEQQARVAQTVSMMQQAGYPEADIEQFVQSQMPQNVTNIGAPSAAQRNSGNPFAGRRPEDTAAATERAKLQAQQEFLPTELNMRMDAALREAGGKAAVEAQAKRQAVQAENDRSFSLYDTAMKGVAEGLIGASTGPITGRLPAVTANQQKAEGGVSAIAPILKQMFRSAGEGTFTDKDQDLLMAMIPTRADHPEARDWKIANIDRIVREKLGQQEKGMAPASQGGGQQSAVRIQSADDYSRLPAGALYIDPNGMQRRKR